MVTNERWVEDSAGSGNHVDLMYFHGDEYIGLVCTETERVGPAAGRVCAVLTGLRRDFATVDEAKEWLSTAAAAIRAEEKPHE